MPLLHRGRPGDLRQIQPSLPPDGRLYGYRALGHDVSPPPRHRLTLPVITPFHPFELSSAWNTAGRSVSGTWGLPPRKPTSTRSTCPSRSRSPRHSGATVRPSAPTSIDIGVYRMTDMTTGASTSFARPERCCRPGPSTSCRRLRPGRWPPTARRSPAIDRSTDGTSYTTASVTLKAGRLYLMSIVNTAASAAAASRSAAGRRGRVGQRRSTTGRPIA